MFGANQLLYEFPCNEKVRTYLRLEVLFKRYDWFCAQESPIAHQSAISALFDLLDATARSDLRNELIQALERERQNLLAGDEVHKAKAEEFAKTIKLVSACVGKTGQSVRANQWLQLIRTRQTIVGGTCEFDLPQLHRWMNISPETRRAELLSYGETLIPIRNATFLLLELLRANPTNENFVAQNGIYQYSTRNRKSCELAQIRLPADSPYIPEVSANKYMIWIRFSEPDAEHKLHLARNADIPFKMGLCSFC